MNNSTPDPWERQPGEGIKPFEAFCEYRDMGTQRSHAKVADKLNKSTTIIGRWSSQYKWKDRIAAWDDEQDRIIRQQQIEDIKKMRKRHADVATAMIVKAAQALQSIPKEEIKAADVSRMVEVAAKLERISRGDVGEVVEERQGESIEGVTIYIPENHRQDGGDDE